MVNYSDDNQKYGILILRIKITCSPVESLSYDTTVAISFKQRASDVFG